MGNGTLPVVPDGLIPYSPVENPDEINELVSPFADIPAQQPAFYDGCELIAPGDPDVFSGAEGQPHDRLAEASHFLQSDQGTELATRMVEWLRIPGP